MSQIIAVSKVGKNVLTATNPNDFIFHSNYNSLKIIAEGTHQINFIITQFTEYGESIYHSQPITPFVLGFMKYNGKVHMIGNRLSARPPTPPTISSGLDIDNNYIICRYINHDQNSQVGIFKYYIFEVPL